MLNNDQNNAKILISFFLFIVTPIGYLIDLYLFYKCISDDLTISKLSKDAKIGLLILSIGPISVHYLSYKYAKENFGWFRSK